MIDYSKWKLKDISVTALKLDPQNPRLPEADKTLSQRQLIDELVEHEKIYDLAKEIVDKGYYPTEALITVEEEGNKYVLEGNRRLASLKLLNNPDSAPEKYQKKFRALASRVNTEAIKKVRVTIAPSRTAAWPIIMSKHTSSQVKGWSPIMQANFYKQLVDSGMSINDISAQYAIPVGEINSFLRSHTMYKIACSLDLPEEVLAKVLDTREFPISTLDRIIDNPKARKFLGIEFGGQGLTGKVSVNEFTKGYSKIVTDVATGIFDSRKYNKASDIEKYLTDLSDEYTPNLRKKGIFNAEKFTKEPDSSNETPASTKPRVQKIVRNSPSLIPTSFKCRISDARINDVFSELKKLKVKDFKNSSAIMLRVLLELSLSRYMDETGHSKTLIEKHRTKHGRAKDWAPTLKQMLSHMVNEVPNIDPLVIKAVNKLLNDNNIISADTLDFFVHNRRYSPTEDQLRQFWGALETVFHLTLTEAV